LRGWQTHRTGKSYAHLLRLDSSNNGVPARAGNLQRNPFHVLSIAPARAARSAKIMSAIKSGLQAVRARIATAAQAVGRDPGDIELVAVSKTFPASALVEAVDCGQRVFGENYAHEGVAKMLAVRDVVASLPQRLAWHFIGPIQSNKTRLIAEHFDWVQSVDRLTVAQRLSQQRPPHLPELQICIQVNVSGESTKHGVAPEAVAALAQEVRALPHVRLRGLMTIPEPATDPERAREQLRTLRELKERLEGIVDGLDTLSMGMSDDLELAIAEGATMVRIGRAIFGERAPKSSKTIL
jgi:PLP dependent protein